MSFMSIRSVSSGTGSNSSHWSTPAPLTPNYFPDPNEIPLPIPTHGAGGGAGGIHKHVDRSTEEEEDRMEIMVSASGSRVDMGMDMDATPKRATTRPRTPQPQPSATSTAAPATAGPASSSSSSPSPFDVSTPSPSPSIQHYSSVLRQTMRKHYDEAYKRMTTSSSGGRNTMVVDLSWDDEDPIDLHVRMAAYKQQAADKLKRRAAEEQAAAASALPPAESDPMLGKAGPSSARLDDGLPPARPTLLNFRGFSHLSSGDDDRDTPGSVDSEASFEAGSTEDWADMYGAMTPGVTVASTAAAAAAAGAGNRERSRTRSSDFIATRMSLASISTESTITHHSTTTATVPAPAPAPASQGADLGYAQPAAPGVFQPVPTPLPCSAHASGYFAIPTQPLPVPVSRPYGKRPTIGIRQRSRSHPYAHAHAAEKQKEREHSSQEVPRLPTPGEDEMMMAMYPDRSESETIVLRAGLRSQRTRLPSRL